jgi:hypothetical protein
MEILEQVNVVRGIVEKYLNQSSEGCLLDEYERNHVIKIGTSILCTKWKIGFPGGGFVQAFVDNDLMQAVGRADNINQRMLPFYCKLIYNTGYPF